MFTWLEGQMVERELNILKKPGQMTMVRISWYTLKFQLVNTNPCNLFSNFSNARGTFWVFLLSCIASESWQEKMKSPYIRRLYWQGYLSKVFFKAWTYLFLWLSYQCIAWIIPEGWQYLRNRSAWPHDKKIMQRGFLHTTVFPNTGGI